MKSKGAVFLLAVALQSAQTWQSALPNYHYEFPRDHFNHPEYQTEWWYYTGNLHDESGHRYGFELTFFRQGQPSTSSMAAESRVWQPKQIYLAHLAFSDFSSGEFYHTERLNRAGPGLAGATSLTSSGDERYWNGNWQVRWTSTQTNTQALEAVTGRLHLRLQLTAEKPLVINGQAGLSVKGPLPGEASHYVTFTRLHAAGNVAWQNRSGQTSQAAVEGLAWMDHEFFTEPVDHSLTGWDWFAIQLDSKEELMLYRLRDKSGAPNNYSSGTYVDANGIGHFLAASQFTLSPLERWSSAASKANYPVAWKISVPSLGLNLTETTRMKNQELVSRHGVTGSYWEGAVDYAGTMQGRPIHGIGYLEMTGYDQPVDLAAK